MSRADLPKPPIGTDLEWRPARQSDAAGIVSLQDACFDVDGGYREIENEILERWEADECDIDLDTLVAIDPDGRVVATAWSYVPTVAKTLWRAFADNFVHPDYRSEEIEVFVLDWWEARSRQRLAAKQDDLDQLLWHSPYEWQSERISLLDANGYEPVRYFDELGCDLDRTIDVRALDEGLEIRPWEFSPLEDSLAVHNASFADHFGSQPLSPTVWANGVNEFHLSDASFVCYDGYEPVAYLKAAAYPHDFEDKGRKEAWVEGLGTIESHRNRGIASSLLSAAMEQFKIGGMEFAVLGVDSESPTGAYRLYESLGFVRERRSMSYVKKIN